MIEESKLARALRTLGMIAVIAVFLFPVWWMISLSVKPTDILFSRPPTWVFGPIFDAYGDLFSDPAFWQAAKNSAILAIASTLLTVVLGTPTAYSLARLRLRGKTDLMLFVVAGRMAAPLALIIPFFLLFKSVGLLDTHVGLVLVYCTFNLSFYVWVVATLARDLPRDIEGAGEVDGYSPAHVFIRVVLPLMRPAIVGVGMLVFIFAWNEFPFALILGGDGVPTLPVFAASLLTPSGVIWGKLGALAAVSVAPIVVLLFALHRHIISGLSLGAVRA